MFTANGTKELNIKKLLIGACFALIGLIFVSIFGFLKQKETLETSGRIAHTNKVINELQMLENQVHEAVTSQRGYIITKKAQYETASEQSFKNINSTLGRIQKLCRDNETQYHMLESLRHPVSNLRFYSSLTINLVSDGQTKKAVDLVSGGKGQVLLDEIKDLIAKMILHEQELLQERVEADERVRTTSNITVLFSSTAAILFIIFALYLIYSEFLRRVATQKELKRSSEIQNAVLQSSAFAIISTHTDGSISLFNSAAEKLLGYKFREVVGKNPAMWHMPDEVALKADELSQRFGEIIPVGYDVFTYRARKDIIESDIYTYIRKDSSKVKVNLTVTAIRNIEGEVTGFIGIAYDMTKQLEYEAAIIKAKELALTGTRAKSEFLANMSHEIRTPMNAIMGMAELLIEADLTDEQRKYVEIFQRAGESLLNIINDILDLSKIEAGHLELDRAPFQLTTVIQKSVEIIALKAHQKGLELTVDIDEDLPDNFLGDQHRIRQIILNLLGNAVKFTKKGEIILKIHGTSLPTHQHQLIIEVQDTGIGMSEENMQHLFERFAQADSSITKEFGGTGLGLSIAKKLTELMHGEIKIQSSMGLGSNFTVTIILDEDDTPQPTPSPALDMKDSKILIIDDKRTNRLIMRKILEHMGCNVFETDDGATGLELIHQQKLLGQPFQMVIVDSRMPRLNGFEVAEKIQATDELKRPILMMLNSDNRPGDLLKVKELGLQGYLIKPILKTDLIDALNKAHQFHKTIPKPNPSSAPASDKELHILLVDDNDENRLVIRSFLRGLPWKVDEAKNGKEALEQYASQDYDIILMDMQMPVMDGYTATRHIRNTEKETQKPFVPVLALTAYALKEEVDKSFEAGCNSHLSKPISKTNLVNSIISYTSEIDILVDKDLADLIPGYLTSRHKELQKLKADLIESNFTSISALGHKLRGSAGSYGFTALSDIGRELEENGKIKNHSMIEYSLIQYQHYLNKIKVRYS